MPKKTAPRQLKEFGVMLVLALGGLGLMTWGANMTRSTGSFVFMPGGLIALAGALMVAAAFYYHYRKDFRRDKGRKAFAGYVALAAVNGFVAMLVVHFLFRR
jgi:hypothetical protein